MPLTKKVTFQSTPENCNKVQVPKTDPLAIQDGERAG